MTISIKKIISAIWLLMLCCAFAKGQDSAISVKINLSKSYQHINNFGASDAWSCQFIGNWPDEKKNKIADLLSALIRSLMDRPKVLLYHYGGLI